MFKCIGKQFNLAHVKELKMSFYRILTWRDPIIRCSSLHFLRLRVSMIHYREFAINRGRENVKNIFPDRWHCLRPTPL